MKVVLDEQRMISFKFCLLEVLFCVLSVEFVCPWLAALLRVKITIVMALACSRRTCHNVANFFWCRMSVHDLQDC